MLKIQPNPMQQVALDNLRRAWKKNDWLLLHAPTGAGKTALAAFMMDGMKNHCMRSMFVAPYTILINQTAKRFVEYGIDPEDIGIIWGNMPTNYNAPIQIASTATLIRRELPNVDCVFIDECHLHSKLLKRLQQQNIKVVGLSATPYSSFLGNYYQELVKTISMRDLMQDRHIVPFNFYIPDVPDLSSVRIRNGDYTEEDLLKIMGDNKLIGNVVENWLKNSDGQYTIAFCINIAHANYLHIAFDKVGVNTAVIDAHTSHDERQKIFTSYEAGRIKIILSVGTLVAGFDSLVHTIIYCRPTLSPIFWVQALGRGVRKAQGKEYCTVYDHTGTILRLGYPEDIDAVTLNTSNIKDVSSKVKEQAKKEKDNHEVVCPKCQFLKPNGVHKCPKCGFEPVRIANVQIDETIELKQLEEFQKSKEEKQAFYSEMLSYVDEMNKKGKKIKEGWAAYKFKEKFKEFPKGLSKQRRPISVKMRGYIKYLTIRSIKGKAKRAVV